jgi:hypothetical protein
MGVEQETFMYSTPILVHSLLILNSQARPLGNYRIRPWAFRKARESPSLRTTGRNFTVLCDDGHDKSHEGVKPKRDVFLNRHSRIRINIRRKSKGHGVQESWMGSGNVHRNVSLYSKSKAPSIL